MEKIINGIYALISNQEKKDKLLIPLYLLIIPVELICFLLKNCTQGLIENWFLFYYYYSNREFPEHNELTRYISKSQKITLNFREIKIGSLDTWKD